MFSNISGHCTHYPNVELLGGDIVIIPYTTSPDKCEERCQDNPNCVGWSLNTQLTECYLKNHQFLQSYPVSNQENYISGFKSCKGQSLY